MAGASTGLCESICLTESSPEVDTPEGFKKPLYDYQKRVVRAAVDIVQKRYIVIEDRKGIYNDVNDRSPIVGVSNCIRLSDPFGTGKTIMALAIITQLPIPKAIIENNNSILGISTKRNVDTYGRYRDMIRMVGDSYNKFIGFQTEIFKKYNGLLTPRIIVVGIQVLNQWYEAIREFTHCKVFKIGGFHSLKQFYQLFKDGIVNSYDIILVKNGVVTGNFRLDSESDADNIDSRPIINVLGKILDGFCVPWVIYDDFDTIRIPSNARALNALTTIYMSTSNDMSNLAPEISVGGRRDKGKEYDSIVSMIRDNFTPKITAGVEDMLMNTNFNIKCDPDFIEDSLNLPVYFAFQAVYKNPNDKYIKLLGVMGTENAAAIMEGLNADAIDHVAEAVGIKTDPSPAAIFQKILDNEFEKYEHDCLVLEVVTMFEDLYKSTPLEPHPKDFHSSTDQERIQNELIKIAKRWKGQKNRSLALPALTSYKSPAIPRIIDEIRSEFVERKERDGKAINNVKDNLREGDCQICCLPLEDIIIARCCTVTVCGICLKDGFQLFKHLNYKTKQETILGKCPNCMKAVDMQRDLIYISGGFDLDAIENATGTEVQPDSPPPEPVVEETVDEYNTENPKLRALYDIMRRRQPEGCNPIEYRVANLLVGKVEKPRDNTEPIKMIAYAGYNDCLKLMQDYMTEKKIKWFRLGGTFDEITRIKNEFRDYKGDAILFINSNQICAGMNLQFATDGFTYHHVVNENIEAQIAGRWQRVGRTCSFKLWNVRYHNEALI